VLVGSRLAAVLRSRLTNQAEMVLFSIMKTANVADLRNNFAVIAAWISDGETVAIRKRGKPFAKLVPATEGVERSMPKIDFAGRLRKIWGDRVFSDEEVAAMRAAELEGEEG
jgi:antitoxin (DNA-binding transcriptional repressor) of toxin-antitoxin stability system